MANELDDTYVYQQGVLGAMYRPASVSPFFNTPSRKREGGNGSSFPLASLFLATYVTLLVLNHAVLNNKKVLRDKLILSLIC